MLLRTLICLGAVMLAAVHPAGASLAAQPRLKIGFVYVSPVGEAGWTYQHDLGRRAIEKAFGARVETKYVDSVQEGADAERVIRDLAQSGSQLVFTTSFGYMNPTVTVANEFPKVIFEHASGYRTAPNLGVYNARFYEGRYLAGVVAGRMTRTNVAGYVAAFPIPEVLQGINAFTRGMRSVNPKAETRVIWVSSWYDPGKERDAAMTLIQQKADVLTHHTDSTAVVKAAEERGVYAIGYHSDMAKIAPKAQLTASTHDWTQFYVRTVQSVLDGKWTAASIWGGMKEGMVKLAPINPVVPKATRDLVARLGADIAAGRLHPFAGPVRDQRGHERVAAGRNMTDDDLQKMDYYVEGVQGRLP